MHFEGIFEKQRHVSVQKSSSQEGIEIMQIRYILYL